MALSDVKGQVYLNGRLLDWAIWYLGNLLVELVVNGVEETDLFVHVDLLVLENVVKDVELFGLRMTGRNCVFSKRFSVSKPLIKKLGKKATGILL